MLSFTVQPVVFLPTGTGALLSKSEENLVYELGNGIPSPSFLHPRPPGTRCALSGRGEFARRARTNDTPPTTDKTTPAGSCLLMGGCSGTGSLVLFLSALLGDSPNRIPPPLLW